MDFITQLQERIGALEAQAQGIVANADGRELSNDEASQVDALIAEIEGKKADLDRRLKLQSVSKANAAPQPRKASQQVATRPQGMDLNAWVRAVAVNPESLRAAAATTYGNETTAADGGYLAPAEYSRTVQTLLQGPASILGLCDSITTVSNSIVLPTDEDPSWSAAGIQPEDVAEGAAYTQRKPVFTNLTITLGKTGVLVPVSEELLQDGVGVGDYVARKSAEKLQWALNKKAMTAFLASGAKITVAKTGGAAAGSAPDIDNVLGLHESVPAALRDGAVWFANPRLQKTMMKYVIGQTPVFVPGGSLANAPHDTLLGHPVIWSELCAAVGTAGDLVFVAPKTFYAVTKGAPQASVSTHLYFDADQVAFKVNARAAIASKFSAVITRPDTTTVGNVAVLATRS